MRLTLRPEQRRPGPEPLATDDRRAVLVGIALWAVLGLVGLVVHDRLAAAGHAWWLWVCLAGVLLGGVGLVHLHRRAAGGRRES